MPLFDSNGEALVTTGEPNITSSNSDKAAMLIAGVTPSNSASFLKMDESGNVKIAGFFSASLTPSGTQEITGSVTVNSIATPVTVIQGTSGSIFWKVTGSVGITESVPLTIGSLSSTVTASVRLIETTVTQSVTGTVGITSIATPVTIGNFPAVQTITGSVVLGEQPIQTTGSVTVNNFPVTQSVYVGGINPNAVQTITGTVGVTSVATTVNITGSTTVNSVASPVNVTQGASGSQNWKVTGSVEVLNFPVVQTVTGTVGINSIASPVTVIQGASGSQAWKITGSIKIDEQPVQTTGSVTINSIATPATVVQGNAGTVGQSWFVRISDGTQTLGTGSSAPLYTSGSVHVQNFPVTQSVYIGQISPSAIQNVTGTVGVTSIASPVHQGNSGSQFWKMTGSVEVTSVASPVTVIQGVSGTIPWNVTGSQFIFNNPSVPAWVSGSVGITSVASPIHQGNAGVVGQSWFTRITDGTQVLGTGSSAPIFTSGSVHVQNFPFMAGTGSSAPVSGTFVGGQDVSGNLQPIFVRTSSSAPTSADNAVVVVISPNQQSLPVSTTPANSTPGISFGYVNTAAITNVPVRASTYNEPTGSARRSISSANANDTSAGTGARTVTITYYDSTYAGPYTETVSMNGTTPVNTTNTNICFIEKINVTTVGSNNSNVGILTLFVGTNGTNGTLATVNAGENRTLWCHHYTANGKTSYITGISANNNNSSNVSVFTLRTKSSGSTTPEIQSSDYIVAGRGGPNVTRTYGSAIVITGPSRCVLYTAPAGTPNIINRGSFDFYDQ